MPRTPASNGDKDAHENEATPKRIIVRSEEDAFKILKQALEEDFEEGPYKLEFENWPLLTLRFVGEGYDSTITPQIAEALVELQHAMNRGYAKLVKHSANSTTLTKEERKSIEFKAKVDEGSSIITVDMGNYAETVMNALAGKMTGTELIVTILGLAITGGGLLAYKAFLASRSEDKKVDQETQKAVAMSTQETERLKIFADALTKKPTLQTVHEDFDNVRHTIVKSVGDATQLDVQGMELTQEQARVIALTPRTKAEEVQLNGNYRIVKLDWSKEDEVRISLYGTGKERREFVASMRAHNLTTENKEKLKACEWDRKQIYLSINGTTLRGEVTTAHIVGVEWPENGKTSAAVPD